MLKKYLGHTFNRILWAGPGLGAAMVHRKLPAIRAAASRAAVTHGFDSSALTPIAELIDQLRQRRKDRETCHVIGSGASLCETASRVDPETGSVYTCNFGGLIGLPCDLYLIEMGSFNGPGAHLSGTQAALVNALGPEAGLVVAKNLWEGKLEKAYLDTQLKYPYLVMADSLIPHSGGVSAPSALSRIVSVAFAPPSDILLQFLTSVFTLVQFAVWSGHRRIVIHGLDGYGSHFFHSCPHPRFSALTSELCALLPPVPAAMPHKVGSSARGCVPVIRDYLAMQSVALVMATDLETDGTR